MSLTQPAIATALAAHKVQKEIYHVFGNNEFTLLLQPIGATQHVKLPTIHPAPSKCQAPFLQPIVKQTTYSDPCVDAVYRDDSIITTDRRGRERA